MKRDLAHEIIAAIESLHVDEGAKVAFRQAIERICSTRGAAWPRREDRTTFARGLLGLKVSRATIRDRLIARYGVSRGEAYRTIGEALKIEALKLSQKIPEKETRMGSNGASTIQSGLDEKPP